MRDKTFAHKVKHKLSRMLGISSNKGKSSLAYNILLLTNRDSDNVGDQVIEASDISLIGAAMKNLGVPDSAFKIRSRSASIITQDYIRTGNPALLERAINLIKSCDLVFFGGAPLFNYLYQNFYERTAKTIEIAKDYNKPVVFSAIGIEGYDENNTKCQRLKSTLNFDNVKRITTRDGYELLEKYKENPALFIDKVSDPAVFSKWVMRNYIKDKLAIDKEKKKVGIFIIRANAFVDNKIDFNRNEAADMWVELAKLLGDKGYDYEFITSGHFGDEAFLDRLISDKQVSSKKCVFNINCPEDLIQHMSDYDAIISCRLHPSIIAFSMGIPSVSLVWNSKVKRFYESIGYSDRTVDVRDISAEKILSTLETAVKGGVHHDKEYLMSVYRNIYYALRDSLNINDDGRQLYTYEELIDNLPAFSGTSEKEKRIKLERKFRRTYKKYNQLFEDYRSLKSSIKK